MGCGVSSKAILPVGQKGIAEKNDTPASTTDWKQLLSTAEARKKYIEDGTLTESMEAGHLELRTMLDDPYAQKALGEYATQCRQQTALLCWIDIQSFKAITSGSYQRSTALNIYYTYISDSSVLTGDEISDLDRLVYHASFTSKSNPVQLHVNFYDKVQQSCLDSMYRKIFVPFKQTNQYADLCRELRERYNHVSLEDFDFYSKLGEGGFGFVVHCRKKSTGTVLHYINCMSNVIAGKHFAMKLQRKQGLVTQYKTRPHKIDYEKQAFAICQHPFIVSLDYAFQTRSLAIMVLELDTAGDLYHCLKQAPDKRLPPERVRFYAAELVLALSYMHSLGLIYRDLKPQNVLLSASGHIQLTDLGGVMDEGGELLEDCMHSDEEVAGDLVSPLLLARQYGSTSERVGANGTSGKAQKKTRALSIMGTLGYMAPEMMDMINVYKRQRPLYAAAGGTEEAPRPPFYTSAVDWWSLGVTMFKLLTGSQPFKEQDLEDYISPEFNKVSLHNPQENPANIHFPPHIDRSTRNLISRFLDANYQTRLGSGEGGEEAIRAHPYFASIDWNQLEQKQIAPPVRPRLLPAFQSGTLVPPAEGGLRGLLKQYDKEGWLDEIPDESVQSHFKTW